MLANRLQPTECKIPVPPRLVYTRSTTPNPVNVTGTPYSAAPSLSPSPQYTSPTTSLPSEKPSTIVNCTRIHLNFRELTPGQSVSNELKKTKGVSFRSTVGNLVRVVNTSQPVNVTSLGSPNESCGGPGQGSGGIKGSTFENCERLDNVLIVQGSSQTEQTLIIDFARQVRIKEIVLFNIKAGDRVVLEVS
jgi:hypothetical protein